MALPLGGTRRASAIPASAAAPGGTCCGGSRRPWRRRRGCPSPPSAAGARYRRPGRVARPRGNTAKLSAAEQISTHDRGGSAVFHIHVQLAAQHAAPQGVTLESIPRLAGRSSSWRRRPAPVHPATDRTLASSLLKPVVLFGERAHRCRSRASAHVTVLVLIVIAMRQIDIAMRRRGCEEERCFVVFCCAGLRFWVHEACACYACFVVPALSSR